MDLGSSIRRRRKSSKRGQRRQRGQSGQGERGERGERGDRFRLWPPWSGPSSGEERSLRTALRSLGAAIEEIRRRPSGLAERPWLLAALVVGAGLGVGYLVSTGFFFRPAAAPPALQGVPETRGHTLGLATAALADSGLAVGRVDSIRHPRVPAGIVIGQSPLPGRTALPAAAVRVTVSLGPEVRSVPDVTRLPGSRAAAVLEQSGFVVAVDTVQATAPAGQVIRIEPEPGTLVAIPGDVRVAVSHGPPTVPMPALAGLNQAAAFNLLSALGLVVSEVDYRYSLLNVNLVFGQYPAPLTWVELGSEVRLVIGQRVRAPIGTFFRRQPAGSRNDEEEAR